MVSGISNIGYTAFQAPQKAVNQSAIEGIIEKAQDAEKASEGQKAIKALEAASGGASNDELTEEEQKLVDELEQTDREVRSHEQAHKTIGGPYAGAISYETTTGPDGKEYAVSGEVQIDASPISGNPEATIRKLDIVIRAALAPAEPSSQDFAVARAAQAARQIAQQELAQQREAENAEARAENAGEQAEGLSEEQKSQLTQLLESIDAIQAANAPQRGSLLDAIN